MTADFPLINIGDGNTTNLVATLQNSGGITPSPRFRTMVWWLLPALPFSRPLPSWPSKRCLWEHRHRYSAPAGWRAGSRQCDVYIPTWNTSNSGMTFSNSADNAYGLPGRLSRAAMRHLTRQTLP